MAINPLASSTTNLASLGTAATAAGSSAGNTGASGISADVYKRVEQTMMSQNNGATRLNAALASSQTKLSGLGQLQSALASFQATATALTGSGLSTAAASSDKTVLTASATGAAKAGTYALNVQQLAQGQFLTSAAFSAATTSIGSGVPTTVKIDFGTAGDKGFTTNGTATSKTITLDSSNNTLDGIAAAFKAAGVDVKVEKGDDGKVSLAIAGQSGAANSMRISVSGDAALKSLLGFDPDSKQNGLKQTAAAQDAILTVDGKTVTSASNTLDKDKAIPGAALTLTGKGKADVTITQDASKIGDNLKTFVAAYNDLNAKLKTLSAGALKGDTALGQVTMQMDMLLKTGGGSVSVSALAAAGVSQGKDGNLVIDDKKLQAALGADSSQVARLFTGDGKGLADLMNAKATAFTDKNSVIGRETSQVNRELDTTNTKRAALTKALTAQATALAALYSAQAQTGSGGGLFGTGAGGSSGTGTLFDLLG
ncbi:flagellar hook 2 domain-containing protein [Duganella sp. Leaf126]|uniref:flagellar filament capping protein FliD n=1 Tax=Duganella sp. Leaf126 TaxID=1736266 RepID=UPI0006FFBB60|nr:flagellar filament capping protein FliD [Duganella sp. Leaf126]KQQ45842.1 flagellar hook 2 domain-containing protein [Duganella sp. Leaf126]